MIMQPHQSQTQDAAEVLADQIEKLEQSKDDFVYLDLISHGSLPRYRL